MKTLKDFQSKFCEDCTGACQGMCYGFISAEDQFQVYKEAEYMRDKYIEIMPNGDDGFIGSIIGEDVVYFKTEGNTVYEVWRKIIFYIRENSGIDSE